MEIETNFRMIYEIIIRDLISSDQGETPNGLDKFNFFKNIL